MGKKKLVVKSKTQFFKLVARKMGIVIFVIVVASVLEKFGIMSKLGKGGDAILAVLADHMYTSFSE